MELGRELGNFHAFADAGVGRQYPGTTGVTHDGHAPPGGDRLMSQDLAHVEELFDRLDAHDACLMEQCVDGLVRGRQCGGMGRRRSRSCSAPSALHRHDGFAPAHTPGDPAELARVPERFQIQQNHITLIA